jgi:hypothetical protein
MLCLVGCERRNILEIRDPIVCFGIGSADASDSRDAFSGIAARDPSTQKGDTVNKMAHTAGTLECSTSTTSSCTMVLCLSLQAVKVCVMLLRIRSWYGGNGGCGRMGKRAGR